MQDANSWSADLLVHHLPDADLEKARLRRAWAQMQVRSLEYEAQQQARRLGEARAAFEFTQAQLAAAQEDLKQIETEHKRQED
jgi:hypothetical protein